jgi:murein DD-endopeptidase MepM/ murein hydrolase activator NlpD
MKKYNRLLWISLLSCVFGVLFWSSNISPALADSIDDLRDNLKEKRDNLKKVDDKIKKYKEDIQIKKKEARSLEDQIVVIEDNIGQLRLSIDRTVAEIEKTNSEIEVVGLEIEQIEEEIVRQKELLMEYIRSIHDLNQQSSITIFLKYQTFSEAINETATLEELQDRGREALIEIKQLKEELDFKRSSLEDFKDTLSDLQARQEQQQSTLAVSRKSKEAVLTLTKAQEEKYKDLLEESKVAHKAAEAEIKNLDAKIREELRKQGIGNLPSVGTMVWPVKTIFGISCEFHCPGYPYAYLLGAHSGIDIPTYVGTPVRAAADGYVGRVRNAGGPGYSYILLIHGDQVSTVYGHLSGFNVKEGQMVSRGSVIGYTGGAPGTNGAGLSSGPHLHFEVRKNNQAINPRLFL